ncbi:hypothetical protein BGZ58_008221 [Dissophora ornata]|nr:hypothetical protein BGZ58_008221 [Dissophora ornata]
MAEFRRYMASKAAGAGPDLILNVAEYATFLPRPFGFKDRSYDRTPSIGSNNINNKCNDWMIAKLPAMISPNIPAWAMAPRPVTGGKQPGKVPAVPPDLGASSDDSSSDSDRESDIHTSAAESESIVMSETDTNPRYKTIG